LLLATIRVPYQFSNLEKSKKFLHLNKINESTKMPVNSAIFGTLIILVYIVIYYITNTVSFFTAKNFDISAIPIIFIYLVNGALFIGLFQLFNRKLFSRNSLVKKIMAVIAVLGIAVVLFGTASAPNGITYFIINIFFLLLGYIFLKKN
jgi:APA family basic amino acid/polyamine antiporter